MCRKYNDVGLRENIYRLVRNGTANQHLFGKTQTSNNFAVCQRTETATGYIVYTSYIQIYIVLYRQSILLIERMR